MNEMLIAYLIWLAIALLFVVLGIVDMVNAHCGKPVGFYNIGPPPKPENLTDVTAYNRAVGKLLISAGIVFALLGLPLLLCSDNEAILILLCMPGTFAWVIGMALIYELKIMKKYRRKK